MQLTSSKQNLRLCQTSFTALLAMLAPTTHALTPSQIYEKVKDSVVVVRTFDSAGKPVLRGSGVILPSRRIATNCHILKNGIRIEVGSEEQYSPAIARGGDDEKDICFLEAPELNKRSAELGQTNGLKVGDRVYAVGAPRGLELSLSEGIVSQLRGDAPPLIQTTAAISPGSSGGGLFDADGRLIGFTTLFIREGQNLNFALPVEWAGESQSVNSIAQKRSIEGWTKPISTFEASKDWQGMGAWCAEWVQAQPQNSQAWTCLGRVLSELKQYNEVIKAYQQAVRLDTENSAAWSGLGVAFSELKRNSDAVDAFQQVVRIMPQDADAWGTLAIEYRRLGRYNEAVEAHRRSIAIDPRETISWHDLAVTHKEFGRHLDAIDAYKQAVRIRPDPYTWQFIAESSKKLGRFTDAVAAYKQAIQISTDEKAKGLWWLSIGDAYTKLKRYSDAANAYRQADYIFPDSATILSHLVSTYKNMGNRKAAADALAKLQSIDSDKATEISKTLGVALPNTSSGRSDNR